MKKINFLIFVFSLTFIPSLSRDFFPPLVKPVFAKKVIGSQKAGTATVSTSIIISPRLRRDRKALQITFSNLSRVSSFSYELTYFGSGIDQGVFGSVTPKGENSTYRELLFGTCSHNVCRYHSGIQNMIFTVTANLKDGRKIIKKYRVRP